jgi:hypothetical protein
MTITDIKQAVCDVLEITPEGLVGRCKCRTVQEPRNIALALAYTFRDELGMYETQICRHFARPNGGAARLAYAKVMHRYKTEKQYAEIVKAVCAKLKGTK